jgi:1-acyl-sn-glycerol-3-phosphate acyltransferase
MKAQSPTRLLPLWLRLAVITPVTLIGIPLQWLAVKFDLRAAAIIPVLYHRFLCRVMGVRVIVRGERDAKLPALILANHVSWLDIPVMSTLGPLSFIAKTEVGTWPVVGLLARLQRSVFIDRTRRSATATANAAVAARLGRRDAIVLFAEGTTGDGTRVLPFRSSLVGAVREALTASADARIVLQPLTITYIRRGGLPLSQAEQAEIAWYGDMDLAPHLKGVMTGGPIDVCLTWGEAILFDASTDRKAATRLAEKRVREAMRAARAGRGLVKA